MNFKALLPDMKALDESRNHMYYIRAVIKDSVHYHAKAALDNAQDVLDVAMASGPLVETYTAQYAYKENVRRVREGIRAATMVNQGILNLEETTDPDIDESNEDYKASTMDFPMINALLEGATNRMNMAQASFPENPRPGSLCNGGIYTRQPEADAGEDPPPAA